MSEHEKENQWPAEETQQHVQNLSPEEREKIAAAGQQAIQEAVEKYTQPRMNFSDLVEADPDAEIIKSNQYLSGGWMHGPALFEMFANTDERLTRIANQLGRPVRKVERVRAVRKKGTKTVFIWPTHREDRKGIEVKRYSSSAWINLIRLLKPAGLAVETGFKERYHVYYAEPSDPVYPALKLDLNEVLERALDDRSTSRKKKEKQSKAQGQDQTQSQAQQVQTPEQAQDQTQQPQPQTQSEIQPTPPPVLPQFDPDLEDEMEE